MSFHAPSAFATWRSPATSRHATTPSTTYSRCRPSVCRFRNLAIDEPPPSVDWRRVRSAAFVAAVATLVSQVPAAPLDVASKLVRRGVPGTPQNLPAALARLFATSGLRGAFRHLGISCLKRVPTKALTVAFFEIGMQTFARGASKEDLAPRQHLRIAIGSGALALALTYPLHAFYYASKKGVPAAHIMQAFNHRWPLMFSGALPALLSTAPAATMDYAVYKQLRCRMDGGVQASGQKVSQISIIAAATAATLCANTFSEPLKAVSRRMVAEAVRTCTVRSMTATARVMMQGGAAEFWRGYGKRVVRYAVSAVVSKTAAQQLRRNGLVSTGDNQIPQFAVARPQYLRANVVLAPAVHI